jgi:regulatory associated protein of mTOR
MILTSKEHKNTITNVVWQSGAGHELVSGSKSGEIKLWDIRVSHSKLTIVDANSSEMNALDVHHNANVIAR